MTPNPEIVWSEPILVPRSTYAENFMQIGQTMVELWLRTRSGQSYTNVICTGCPKIKGSEFHTGVLE